MSLNSKSALPVILLTYLQVPIGERVAWTSLWLSIDTIPLLRWNVTKSGTGRLRGKIRHLRPLSTWWHRILLKRLRHNSLPVYDYHRFPSKWYRFTFLLSQLINYMGVSGKLTLNVSLFDKLVTHVHTWHTYTNIRKIFWCLRVLFIEDC